MNRLLTKYGTVILSIAVVIAVLLSVMTYFSANSAVFNNIVGTVAAPLRTVGTVISNQVGEWLQYFTDFDELKRENEQLRQELAGIPDLPEQLQKPGDPANILPQILALLRTAGVSRSHRINIPWIKLSTLEFQSVDKHPRFQKNL